MGTKRPDPLDLLALALEQTALATHWRLAFGMLPHSTPRAVRDRALGYAVAAEDTAFATVNNLRVRLGGQPLPDPADPPPVRPDD